jgi:hypothetical protein
VAASANDASEKDATAAMAIDLNALILQSFLE